jgi:hypothetical protein
MNLKECHKLCKTTKAGTALTFTYGDQVIKGHFIGCGRDEVVIEANGKQYVWPRELCDVRKSDYPRPRYS